MKLWTPHEGLNPRALSVTGEEVWAPATVGRHVFVSNLGRVYDGSRAKELPVTFDTRTAQRYVFLRGIGKRSVARLVLGAFDGHGANRRVRRSNDDLGDNRLCNIHWGPATRGPLHPNERAALLQALEDGESQADVARRFGLTPSHVNYYARKLV